MIYKVGQQYVQDLVIDGAKVFCWQFDGKYALVDYTLNVPILEQYKDEELSSLMKDALWMQPCNGCRL